MDTPGTSHPSLFERARQTFLAPSQLAISIREQSPWIDALLLSTIIAVAAVATVPDQVFITDMEDAVTRRGVPVEIVSSPEEIARWGRMMGMIATIGTHPVIAFIVAAVVFAVAALIFRAQVSYRDLVAVASHALLIPALGTVIRVIGRAAGIEFIDADPGWPLLLRAFLSIDPYIVWMLIVMAVGAHALNVQVPRLRAGALLVGGYLALVFASTAILHPPGAAAERSSGAAEVADSAPAAPMIGLRIS